MGLADFSSELSSSSSIFPPADGQFELKEVYSKFRSLPKKSKFVFIKAEPAMLRFIVKFVNGLISLSPPPSQASLRNKRLYFTLTISQRESQSGQSVP